jgi:sigma-B regulation protein RsbU (phosphoserine phosphatase)
MSKSGQDPDRVIAVLSEVDDRTLADALRQPVTACVEAGTMTLLADFQGCLVLILTTANAFGIDMGTLFADALIDRQLIDPERRDDVYLALHEALANGLMHGNLDLSSDGAESPDDFLRQAELMQERLLMADYGKRPIALACAVRGTMLEISVRDWGPGFTPPTDAAEPKRLSGRGLYLMTAHSDALRYEERGRRVVLSYNMKRPAHA